MFLAKLDGFDLRESETKVKIRHFQGKTSDLSPPRSARYQGEEYLTGGRRTTMTRFSTVHKLVIVAVTCSFQGELTCRCSGKRQEIAKMLLPAWGDRLSGVISGSRVMKYGTQTAAFSFYIVS